MRAATLVGKAGADGWLLQMAFLAEPKPEAFQELHNSVTELLQVCRVLHRYPAYTGPSALDWID